MKKGEFLVNVDNQVNKYKVLYQGGQGEIVEKKSRFIATTHPVTTEAQAQAFIEEIRKQYWDARHNCHAFVLGPRQELTRCSDDKEPAGTAGKPMLDVLLGQEVTNVAVVVTRYFGGTLLGTGGLVRAYSKAVQEALAASTIVEKKLCRRVQLTTDYTGIGKIQYIIAQESLFVLDTIYETDVKTEILVPVTEYNAFEKKIIEGTNGKTLPQTLDYCYGGLVDGQTEIFETFQGNF